MLVIKNKYYFFLGCRYIIANYIILHNIELFLRISYITGLSVKKKPCAVITLLYHKTSSDQTLLGETKGEDDDGLVSEEMAVISDQERSPATN